MTLIRRTLAALVALTATAVLLLSLAGVAAVWVVREPLTERVTGVFNKVELALDKADRGLAFTRTSLTDAAGRLAEVRREQAAPGAAAPNPSLARRLMARTIQQRIAPRLGEAQVTLAGVADAAVVIQSLLADLADLPLLANSSFDSERLTRANEQVAQVVPAAWELSRLLGEADQDPSTEAQFTRVEEGLKSASASVSGFETQMTEVRQRFEVLRAKTLWAIPVTAVIVTVICSWIALSQISLLFHARSWWLRAG